MKNPERFHYLLLLGSWEDWSLWSPSECPPCGERTQRRTRECTGYSNPEYPGCRGEILAENEHRECPKIKDCTGRTILHSFRDI